MDVGGGNEAFFQFQCVVGPVYRQSYRQTMDYRNISALLGRGPPCRIELFMDDAERDFVWLYAVGEKKYSEIEEALGCDRARVQELFDRTANERKLVREIKRLFLRKKIKISFSEFYGEHVKRPKECCYCGVTQAQIDLLFEQKKIHTKRQGTRGRSLELERVKPNERYENTENLRLACYWCNNAKSDEFSMEEFKSIAEGIGKALRGRLP